MLTESTLHFLAAGSLLGLSAGVSPGPLLTLVLTQTIKHNKQEGIKVALSPLLTDLPIVLLTLYVFNQLSHINLVLAIISFLGGLFVAYLGVESFRTEGIDFDTQGTPSGSIKKGVIANFLSPHPYLFWATVGAPYVYKASAVNIWAAVFFLASFYVFLIGSKVTIAVIVARTKVFIGQKSYRIIMRILGIALLIFSILFFYDGVNYIR